MSNIYYLLNVKLVDEVPMLERDRKRALEWLKNWDPKMRVKAALTSTMDAAVDAFRKDFEKLIHSLDIVQHAWPLKNFEFTIGVHEPEEIDGVVRVEHDCGLARVVGYNVNASNW